jgi:hypothetical protein
MNGPGGAMTGKTFELEFAKFIVRFREQIMEAFLEDAFQKRNIFPHSPPGREMAENVANNILLEFTKNVDRNTEIEYIKTEYTALGTQCREQALGVSEMVHIFVLLKRHIWLFFQDSNFAGQPFDVRSIVALNNRTALFFDRAIQYFVVGYEKAKAVDNSELETMYFAFLNKVRRDLGLTTES